MTDNREVLNTEQETVLTWTITVHLSSGLVKEHIYPMPLDTKKGMKIINSVQKFITDALSGDIEWFSLKNPTVIYMASYVVCIETVFRGPDEWLELMKESVKEPIGFKPESRSLKK